MAPNRPLPTPPLHCPHHAVHAELLEGVAAAVLDAAMDSPDIVMETPEQPDRPEQPAGSAGAGLESNDNDSDSDDDGEQYSFGVEDDTDEGEGENGLVTSFL